MKNLESKIIKTFNEYKAGEQEKNKKVVKINANENPYPPSKNVIKTIKEFKSESLKYYANEDYEEITKVIAKKHNLKKENVLTGNGSDDILNLCFLSFFYEKENILMPDLSYGFYPVWSNLYKVKKKEIKVNKVFEIDLEKYKNGNGVIFANPNSPTGKAIPLNEIESFVKKNKDIPIVIDEAYIDFVSDPKIKTFASLVSKYKNVVVVRTFSKAYPLAGLRLGYALGSKEMIRILNKVRHGINPYPISQITEEVGVAAIKDEKYYKENIKKMLKTKQSFTNKLKDIGFICVPSETNFVLAKHAKVDAKKLQQFLKTKGVLVRYFDIKNIKEYLRISIGTKEDMEKTYRLINEYIKKI